jgi:anti-sigma-K factor RskA
MSLSMPSHQIQELIAGYVLGDLSSEEAVELEKLLVEHPELIQEIAAVQQTLELSYAPPAVTPPASLRARVLVASQLGADAQMSRGSLEPFSSSPQRRLVWGRAAGIAAAALIVALGIANYRLWQTLQSLQADRPDRPGIETPLTYALQGTDFAQNATAEIVVDPVTLNARLVVEDLPPLPNGKVYVLWTVVGKEAPFTTDDKGAILTQVFQVNEQGDFSGTIEVPAAYHTAGWVTRLAITMEDAARPQAHQGVMALTTPI